jgi:hypothetical protein
MPSTHLLTGFGFLFLAVAALVLVHACHDGPEPTESSEPDLAVSTIKKTLYIVASGTGDGVVTSNPAGIKCTVTAGVIATTGCRFQFTQGTSVTLAAVPKAGHSFRNWYNYCSGTQPCKVPMTVNRTVGAKFLKGPFTIKIVSGTVGVGSGTVKTQAGLTPAINCVITNGVPASIGCSARYPAYTALTLTATPTDGFGFSAWGAPCSGTGPCQYTVLQSLSISAKFDPTAPSTAPQEGRWEAAFTTPVVAVHMSQLPNGKMLIWGDNGQTQVWNPATSAFTSVTKSFEFFCSGHTITADGKVLVTGGRITGELGEPRAALFDPVSNNWSTTATMAHGRWYPTTTMLPDGQALTMSGSDETGAIVAIPEVWNGSSWRELTTAGLEIPRPYYPAMFVAPNGKVFMAGWTQTSMYLDVSGTGEWTTVGDRTVGDRNYGSAVMYAPGKILYAGGGDPPTATAEVIDLNDGAAAWRSVPGMAFARRHLDATLLADGQVLVTGGTSGAGFNNVAGAVYFPELWNPATESWTTMAREPTSRVYHSTAMLLPDGRVLSSGSGEGGGVTYANSQLSAQIFTPPYLFNPDGTLATRPTITAAPAAISYGQTISVETPNAAEVTRGTLIRLSSVTHALNMSQAVYPLTLSATGPTTVEAAGPSSGNLAPPGPYMLFLLNAAGVPSVAKIVTVGP